MVIAAAAIGRVLRMSFSLLRWVAVESVTPGDGSAEGSLLPYCIPDRNRTNSLPFGHRTGPRGGRGRAACAPLTVKGGDACRARKPIRRHAIPPIWNGSDISRS